MTIDLSKKSEWVPKPSKNVILESFIDSVKSDILRTAKVNTDTFDNFTPGERTLSANQQTKAVLLLLCTNLPTFERSSANLVMTIFKIN